jgi:hypothetical protein
MKLSFLDKIIQKLGRENYAIDKNISFYNLLIIIVEKSIEMTRGLFLKFFLKKQKELFF